jgi:cell division ATPase FtsA
MTNKDNKNNTTGAIIENIERTTGSTTENSEKKSENTGTKNTTDNVDTDVTHIFFDYGNSTTIICVQLKNGEQQFYVDEVGEKKITSTIYILKNETVVYGAHYVPEYEFCVRGLKNKFFEDYLEKNVEISGIKKGKNNQIMKTQLDASHMEKIMIGQMAFFASLVKKNWNINEKTKLICSIPNTSCWLKSRNKYKDILEKGFGKLGGITFMKESDCVILTLPNMKGNNVLLIDIGAGSSDVTFVIDDVIAYNGSVTIKTKTHKLKKDIGGNNYTKKLFSIYNNLKLGWDDSSSGFWDKNNDLFENFELLKITISNSLKSKNYGQIPVNRMTSKFIEESISNVKNSITTKIEKTKDDKIKEIRDLKIDTGDFLKNDHIFTEFDEAYATFIKELLSKSESKNSKNTTIVLSGGGSAMQSIRRRIVNLCEEYNKNRETGLIMLDERINPTTLVAKGLMMSPFKKLNQLENPIGVLIKNEEDVPIISEIFNKNDKMDAVKEIYYRCIPMVNCPMVMKICEVKDDNHVADYGNIEFSFTKVGIHQFLIKLSISISSDDFSINIGFENSEKLVKYTLNPSEKKIVSVEEFKDIHNKTLLNEPTFQAPNTEFSAPIEEIDIFTYENSLKFKKIFEKNGITKENQKVFFGEKNQNMWSKKRKEHETDWEPTIRKVTKKIKIGEYSFDFQGGIVKITNERQLVPKENTIKQTIVTLETAKEKKPIPRVPMKKTETPINFSDTLYGSTPNVELLHDDFETLYEFKNYNKKNSLDDDHFNMPEIKTPGYNPKELDNPWAEADQLFGTSDKLEY